MASIVVVGAGMAGLSCAWQLARAGHDVEVLEREREPGGRVRSLRQAGFTLERGAQFVAGGYRHTRALLAALGLAEQLRPLGGLGEAVLREGRLLATPFDAPLRLLASPALSRGARLRLARLPVELLRHWRRLDPLHPEHAAEIDVETLAQGAARVVGEEALATLVGPAFSATFDCEPEDLSFAFALLWLRLLAGGLRPAWLEGGNGRLPERLAERVPVRFGCEVVSVETETDGARVRYLARGRESRVFADAAVVALPGSEVALLCPKLTPEERGFFEGVRYGRGMLVHLMLERAPLSLPWSGVAFPRREGLELYGIAVDHHKPGAAPPGAGLLNAALCRSAAERLWQASDAAVADCAIESLAYTPIGRLSPVGFAVERWSPMLPQFGAGALRRLARFLARSDRSPRLAFAGDYLVGPCIEGAVASGARAATAVERELAR